jgi:hypothetical protein
VSRPYDYETDEHGDFKYTLRQYLLMRRLNLGGEWTDVCTEVSREVSEHGYAWDLNAEDTYRNWQGWYYGRTPTGPIDLSAVRA